MPIIRNILVAVVLIIGLTGCGSDDPTAPVVDPITDYRPPLIEVTFSVGADEYLNNRFFQLDLPLQEPQGRVDGERIDPSSIKVFKYMRTGELEGDDLSNIAAYIDSSGFRSWSTNDIDFASPLEYGFRWRQITGFDILTSFQANREVLDAIDLRSSMLPEDILAVVYSVIDETGNLIAHVGDDPSRVPPQQMIPGEDAPYYRMKILKAPVNRNHQHLFDYVLRNIYSLGVRNIDIENFDLWLERNDSNILHPELATESLPWIRLFGLDQQSPDGSAVPDGLIDLYAPRLFDFNRGLLIFPRDNPQPFAANEEQYMHYVEPEEFTWEGSFLDRFPASEIYDMATLPSTYHEFRYFEFKGTYLRYDLSGVLADELPLDRNAWSWASAPVNGDDPDYVAATHDPRRFTPADRVENVRWFLPRERTLRSHLNPDLTGNAATATQPVLDLYLRTNSGVWEAENWGGIMVGVWPYEADISGYQSLEIWVNDGQTDSFLRSGKLHLDYGFISEDGFWPETNDGLDVGTYQKEDANSDGVWVFDEDNGLDGRGESGPQRFIADYEVNGDTPYPFINGTARNNREDDEDLNHNGRFGLENGYFTHTIDLAQTAAVIDVVHDYENVQGLIDQNIAWRLYRIDLGSSLPIAGLLEPDLSRITHVRIWYENDDPAAPAEVHLQLSGLKFSQ